MKVKIQRLTPDAIIPEYKSNAAAGVDLHSTSSALIAPGDRVLVPTGLAVEIPEGYFGAVYPRSGIAIKYGLRLANCVAVIDADYRGELLVPLYNDSTIAQWINPGDRIAQLIVQPYPTIEYEEVNELSDTERGSGGFGSTGI